MTLVGWSQIVLVLALVVACAVPLSAFVARVFAGERTFLSPVLGPVERGFYRLAGVDPAREQDWYGYAVAMVVFTIAGFLSLYALQRLQNLLPLNPRGFDAVPPDLAFNTSISFITNTNWQNYGGETTMSHLTQMLGLTVHNFLSAGHRSGDGVRARPRVRAVICDDRRQLLGRCDPYQLLHSSPDFVRSRVCLRRPGRPPDACRRGRRNDPRRGETDHIDRADGEPGGH